MDDDMKMLRLGKKKEELRKKEASKKAARRIEEEREKQRVEREKMLHLARQYFMRKLEDALLKQDHASLIGRFTRCLIKIFTKKAMLYS